VVKCLPRNSRRWGKRCWVLCVGGPTQSIGRKERYPAATIPDVSSRQVSHNRQVKCGRCASANQKKTREEKVAGKWCSDNNMFVKKVPGPVEVSAEQETGYVPQYNWQHPGMPQA